MQPADVRVATRVLGGSSAITVAQLDADGKSNEITAFIPLLDQIPCLRNVVVNADMMMHTQRENAGYLHRRVLRAARRRELRPAFSLLTHR
jgi:hypothetical protein